MLGDKNVLKKLIRIVSHIDVGPISEANIKTWHFLNGRLRVGGESAKLADIANQKFDRADIGPIKCVTWAKFELNHNYYGYNYRMYGILRSQ
jgi:hypothetical protein